MGFFFYIKKKKLGFYCVEDAGESSINIGFFAQQIENKSGH